ncbi:MAG: energy transducer TonB [Thermoanaerobaculia bacterium]
MASGRTLPALLLASVSMLGTIGLLAEPTFAEGPLALHAPALLVPDETAGLGLAPEVAVKLAIDARGVVTGVEVTSITPASEYDALFRDRVIETLSSWRFAPATEKGKAVASTLDWRVRFPAKAFAEETIQALAPLPGADAEQRRALVLTLPVSQRRRILETETRTAITFLDPKRTHEFATPRFVVRSDADEERVAATVAGNLESIFNVLRDELLPGIALQPEPFKVQVFVFRTAAQHQALVSQSAPFENSAGYYHPAGLISLHLEQAVSDHVLSILLHEATHAFLDRHILRPGVALPRWLGEGFAEYVGNSAIQKGRLQPGKTFVHKYAFERGRVASFETFAGSRLEEAKEALRRGKGLGVQEMLEASPEIFYGEERDLYYSSAWLLVHYLRDGGAGWSTGRFPQLLLYFAEGYPPGAAFRTLYGDPQAGDAAFRQYVKSF